MKKTTLALSLIALAFGGTALANSHGGHQDPFGDKTVTRAEAQAHAATMFAKHDGNKDGKLDAADRAAHHGAMFEKHDTDKDGKISRAEFDAAHQGGMGDAKDEGPRGKHMAMMMLHHADANKDRAVSKDEFVAAHIAMFEKADADKDGKITPAERQAAHAKMREHMKGKRGGHGQEAGAADPQAGH